MTLTETVIETVTERTPTGAPDRSPSRDDPGTTRCPVCRRCYTPVGRQLYCSTACRKTAFRRRHQQLGPTVTVPAARPRREITVYEWPRLRRPVPRRATLRGLRHLRPPSRHRRRLPKL